MIDVIEPSPRPALSALSDMPPHLQSAKVKAAVAGEATPPATPAAEPKRAESAPPAVAAKPAEPASEAEAEPDDGDTAQAAVDAALAELAAPAEAAAEFKKRRPQRHDFDNPDAYDTAVDGWSSRLATATAKAEIAREKITARQHTARTAIATTFQKRVAKAAELHSDFREVVEASTAPISDHTRTALMTLPGGPLVAYHLAKNPEEAARIFQLSPTRQAAEIGRLAERVAGEASEAREAGGKPQPRASAPRRRAPAAESDPKMSGDAYYDWRMAQKKKAS